MTAGEAIYSRSWNGEEVKFAIRDKKLLSINGRDHGTVKQDDKVEIVNPATAVTVDGEKREPIAVEPAVDALSQSGSRCVITPDLGLGDSEAAGRLTLP